MSNVTVLYSHLRLFVLQYVTKYFYFKRASFPSVFCISDVRERCALNIRHDRDKGLWAEELNIHEDPSDPITDQQTHRTNKTSHPARGYLNALPFSKKCGCLNNVNVSLVFSWGALAAQYELESCSSSRVLLAFFKYHPRKHSTPHNTQCFVRRKTSQWLQRLLWEFAQVEQMPHLFSPEVAAINCSA